MLYTFSLLTLGTLLSAETLAFADTCSNACDLDHPNTREFPISGGNVKYSDTCAAKLQCYGTIQCEEWDLKLENYTFPNLCVENCDLTQELISCMLKLSYNVQTLHLFNVTDVELNHLLSAAPGLKHLKTSHTKIQITSITTTKNFLEALEIEYGDLHELPRNAFSGLSKLRSLRLRHNGIVNISDDTFADLSLLEELDLSDNKLKVIPAKTFRNLTKLILINLNSNRIEELPGKLFASQSSAKDKVSVSVNHNKLRIFSEDTFSDSHFASLSLAGNELTLENENWYRQSLLLKVREIIHLNLSRNLIEEVFNDFGTVLTSLQTLDLTYNKITSYEDSAVSFPNKIDGGILVDLRHNDITYVKVKEKGLDGVRILFDDNPLNCDCELFNLTTQLQNGFKRFLRTDPTCGTPDNLKGQSLRKIRLTEFICNVTEPHCPKSCDCIRKPFSDEFQLICEEANTVPRHDEKIVTLRFNTLPSSLDSLPLSIDKLSLANLSLKDVPKLPQNLTLMELDLSYNTLTYVPEFLFNNNKTQVILAGNRLRCDCEDEEHIEKLQRHYRQIKNYNELQCINDRMVKKLNLKRECIPNWPVVCGGVVGGIGLFGIVILILSYRYKKNIKVVLYALGWFLPCIEEKDIDQDKIYDAFVSFSHLDAPLVAFELVPRLESEPHYYTLCLHYRDWVPGELITTQIVNSIILSRRTIVVLSKNFLKSEWARHEFRTAYAFALREGRVRIIVILLDDVANDETLDPELRSYLSNFTYIEWGDPWFWEKLRYALPHDRRRVRKVRKQRKDKSKEESHELDIQRN